MLAHASGEWLSSDWPVCELARDIVPIGEFSHILAGMIAKVDRFVNDNSGSVRPDDR